MTLPSPRPNLATCGAALLLALSLSACGGGSGDSATSTESNTTGNESEPDDSNPNGSAGGKDNTSNPSGSSDGTAFYGQLIVEPFGAGEQTGASISGDFFRFSGDLDALERNVRELIAEDRCFAFGPGSTGSGGSSSTFSLIDAGEVIVVSATAGTVGSLTRNVEGSLRYFGNVQQLGTQQLTTFDVPGADFPAFAEGGFPEYAHIDVASPTLGEEITDDTVFTWMPTAFKDDQVSITASATLPTGDAFGYSCQLVDDGQFVLPDQLQLQLGNAFVAETTTISINRSLTERRGNVLMQTAVLNTVFF